MASPQITHARTPPVALHPGKTVAMQLTGAVHHGSGTHVSLKTENARRASRASLEKYISLQRLGGCLVSSMGCRKTFGVGTRGGARFQAWAAP